MLGNFVFDIDDTLTVSQSEKEHKVLEPLVRERLGDAFFDRHCLMPIDYPHYIFPGFYALFRWLHDKGGKIFFFSSGIEKRNTPFAAMMMERTFGKNPPEYKVFSREHCIDTTNFSHSEEHAETYQSYIYGQRKKKMGGIIVPEVELSHTLLIEDDYSYMTKGEEYNLVWVESGLGYLPTPPSKQYEEEFYTTSLFKNVARFHKSFYLAGLFSKIIEVQDEKNCTLLEATQEVQMEGHLLNEHRGNWYRSVKRLKYYIEGQKILSQIDPSLIFHYELPFNGKEDWVNPF